MSLSMGFCPILILLVDIMLFRVVNLSFVTLGVGASSAFHSCNVSLVES